VDALWDRASLAKEIGDFRTARNAFLDILKRFPHDLTVLRELHTILVELSELPTCATLLQEALDYYMKIYPTGQGEDAMSGLHVIGGGFSKMDLLLLADLYNVLGEHGRAVQTIRRGTRWLQGRADQKYWDLYEDDREYDQEGWPPRPSTSEGAVVHSGGYELDSNARHRLAVARIKMGDVEEGKVCQYDFASALTNTSGSYTLILSYPKTFLTTLYCLLKSPMRTLNVKCMPRQNPYTNSSVVIRRYGSNFWFGFNFLLSRPTRQAVSTFSSKQQHA